jgi:hypothetical protein
LAKQLPQLECVFVADREADLYDLFVAAAQPERGPSLLIRARHDRRLPQTEESLFEQLSQAPMAGQTEVAVPRRPGQRARIATLAVRFTAVALRAPEPVGPRPKLTLWAVEARELHPPKGVSPIHWRLLSSKAVLNFAEAVEKLRWYCIRWGIEVFHKVVKSGCAAEEMQLQSAKRLQRCLAVKLVVAWRVMALSHAGREQPAAALKEILEQSECRVLRLWARKKSPRDNPRGPLTVGDGIRLVGRLGGHLGRRGDGPPGALRLARGLERLEYMTLGWIIAQRGGKYA